MNTGKKPAKKKAAKKKYSTKNIKLHTLSDMEGFKKQIDLALKQKQAQIKILKQLKKFANGIR